MSKNAPIRILIVEDFHGETDLLLVELKDAELAHEVFVVKDENEYKKALSSFKPEVILSPYSLMSTNAIKLLALARKSEIDAPFILLAFDLSEDIAIDLLGVGIEDYVQHSTLKRLPVAIKKALQRHATQHELKLSETRLRASEESMRNMVRNAPIAVAMFDMNMDYLVVSEFWLKHESKTEDIIGKNHYEVVPEIPDTWKEVHKEVLSGKTHGSEKETMLRADGSTEILRWKMNPWYNHDGEVGGAVLFIEDITEKVEVAKKEEKNQQLLRIGEELSGSGSFEFELATGSIQWSKNLYEITGFSPSEEVSNEAFFNQVHPDDQKAYGESFQKVLDSGEAIPFEYRFIRPDNGKTIYLSVHSTFFKAENGKPTRLIGSVQDITVIRTAKENIEKRQRLLAIGEELSGSGSYEFDLILGTMHWSENMFRIKGFKPGWEFSNEEYLKHVHPEDQTAYQESFAKILTSKKSLPFEYRLVRPDNSKVVHLRVHSTVITNRQGVPAAIIGSVQDFTESYQTSSDLVRSEASLKRAQQIAKVGSWEWTKGEKYVSMSDEMYDIYEVKRKKLTIKDVRAFVHPDDAKRVAEIAANDLTENITPIIDYRIITAKGNEKHVVSSAKQVIDANDNVVQLVGTLQDVTERVSIEAKLAEKESLLGEMAESINEVFWVTNADGDKVLYMSPRYEEVYGKSLESIYADGNSWADNIHPEDKPFVYNEWMENRLDGSFEVEYRLNHPDGSTKWLHAKAFPIKDESGEVVRTAGITHDVTARREMENSLSESEQLFREMAENITEVFWLTDWVNTKVLYTSPRYESLYELPVQSLLDDATSWESRVHPEDLDRIAKIFRETAALGNYDEEFRLVMPNGRVKWVRDRAFPIKDENGKVVRMAGITEEITESRELQNELQEQEQLLRQMAENISGVFYLSDWVNDKVLYTSPQFETLYGLPLDKLYENRRLWEKAVHPDDLPGLLTTFKEQAPLGTFDYEFRLVMKNGTIKWVRDRAFPIKDKDGTVVRMAGITEDISQSKQDEEKIETLSLVASETVNGVLIQDSTGKIEWSNKGFTKIMGYTPSEIIGKRPWSFLAGEETNLKLAKLTYDKVKKGKSFTTENTLYTKEGKPVWISLAVSPILDSAGNLSRMVAIGTDISKQKELEELQRSMLTRMEERVLERTSELESKNLELRKEVWENQRISDELYHSNLDLKDSIQYAKRIQESILPAESLLQKTFPHGFVLFLPRDVVSGDFYWYYRREDHSYFAAIDCTGHGVPGALMSMIANELMNQVVIQRKLTDPAEILTRLNKLMVRTLRQKHESTMRDGMDVSVVVVDHANDVLNFGGAFSNLYLAQEGSLTVYNGNRHSIGGHLEDVEKRYETTSINIKKGDTIYLSTDGYIDQFGGPDGKKLMKKRFVALLEEIMSLPLDEQKSALENKFSEWKGPLNQVDDVLVAGLRY